VDTGYVPDVSDGDDDGTPGDGDAGLGGHPAVGVADSLDDLAVSHVFSP
jgi:hypothetical protein